MKSLDDQVPSGYFEGLPSRTLARLGEDLRMETSSRMSETSGSGSTNTDTGAGGPPQERDEDSGLHDIRSMASSTKMRLSRRHSTVPPVEDDILASSSAGWKAVALPEPAKMVSLPSLDELAPVSEIKADRKSKKELKAERTSASKIASEAIAVETSPVPASSPANVAAAVSQSTPEKPAAAVTPILGARVAKAAPKAASRSGLYAGIGLAVAAAAGVGWYVSTQMKSKPAAQVASVDQNAAAPSVQQGSAATVARPTVEPIAPEPAPTAVPAAAPSDGVVATGAVGGEAATEAAKADESAPRGKSGKAVAAAKPAKREDKDKNEPKAEAKPAEPAKPAEAKKAEGSDGEPSFDALLKEAGVQEKKTAQPVLEKKSLSGADIKKGMSGVGPKAQACYAGTQGTAQVKLTVGNDGAVQKVAVTGVFAGTPVGACVEAAVKGAAFPPWDGGPQSFGYSYLLAE